MIYSRSYEEAQKACGKVMALTPSDCLQGSNAECSTDPVKQLFDAKVVYYRSNIDDCKRATEHCMALSNHPSTRWMDVNHPCQSARVRRQINYLGKLQNVPNWYNILDKNDKELVHFMKF